MRQNATQTDYSPTSHELGASWSILSPIELSIKRKIEAVGKPLKDWDIKIYRGILTGCNEAFIIDGAKREEILNNCKTEDERKRTDALIRPILRGRDIKRYKAEWAGLYLLYIPWHFPLHLDPTITGASQKAEKKFSEHYPAVYNYLYSYKDILSKRNKAETGIRYEWYALQRWGANYMDDFLKQKIVWARLMRMAKNDIDNFPRFSTADSGIYVVDSLCFFTGNDIDKLCIVLNSEYAAYYFFGNVAVLDNGGFQMRQQYVENIPIPDISEIVNEVDVYAAFGFTELEISYIKTVVAKRKNEIINGVDR